MSLKAKLEAVIYAAEEPVTLTQLALLFTADALEWKAEQEAAVALAAEVTAPATAENAEFDHLLAGEAEPAELEPTEEAGQEVAAATAEEPAVEAVSEAGSETEAAETGSVVAESEDSELDQEADKSAEPVSDAEAETAQSEEAAAEASLKREARMRDRQVKEILRQLLDELIAEYASDNRGVEIREIAGGYRMATKPECHDAVRSFVKSLKPALKLSLPALETLAVIAYKQPVTAPEVNEIRGVDSSGVFGSLLARKLIATAGRKPVIGRPILYKTTKEFLMRFGLKDVTELPSMEEFEKMAAIELDEPEMEGQPETSPAVREDPNLEFDAARSDEPLDEPAAGLEDEATIEAAPAAPPLTE
ncbi:MAG: SMC-Scp complex subunit ScpB [Terracidiphilus sp.]